MNPALNMEKKSHMEKKQKKWTDTPNPRISILGKFTSIVSSGPNQYICGSKTALVVASSIAQEQTVGKGHFNFPDDLCVQPHTGHLLVCDKWNHQVQVLKGISERLDPLYTFGGLSGVDKKAGTFCAPSGVCCNSDGSIVVADNLNKRIQFFDASGRHISSFNEGNRLYSPFCVRPLHHIFAPSSEASSLLLMTNNDWGHDSKLCVYSQQLQRVQTVKSSVALHSVCVSLKGYVYVSESLDDVIVLDPRRNWEMVDRLERLPDPGKMCFDDTNTLAVVLLKNVTFLNDIL